MRFTSLKSLIFTITLMTASPSWSSGIDGIITAEQPPTGVVFEIVSDEEGLLSELLPSVKHDIDELRKRFPGLPVAIVTHGSEQFDLTSSNRSSERKAHELIEGLVKTEDVDVHVCGTHAGWYGVTPDDFPDYVDVSATGPAQINDYEEMGYEVIVLP